MPLFFKSFAGYKKYMFLTYWWRWPSGWRSARGRPIRWGRHIIWWWSSAGPAKWWPSTVWRRPLSETAMARRPHSSILLVARGRLFTRPVRPGRARTRHSAKHIPDDLIKTLLLIRPQYLTKAAEMVKSRGIHRCHISSDALLNSVNSCRQNIRVFNLFKK